MNFVDLWGLADIVIFSAIDNADNLNNIGYNLLVNDSYKEIIKTAKEQEAFADGYFTNTRDTGIAFGTVREGDGSRYRYIGDDYGAGNGGAGASSSGNLAGGYRLATSTRATSTTTLFAKGEALATTKLGSTTERSYFGKDILGSVRSVTSDTGNANYYDYDAFGTPFGNDISDYAYAGKAYDPITGMYNYGFRDYTPQVARFSTMDPIKDGANWFAYCEGDPVNKVDLWGLELKIVVDKDTQTMTATITVNGLSVTKKFDVTTAVVSKNSSKYTDTSRTQKTGSEKTNPTQFPNGTSKITGTKQNPIKDDEGNTDNRYGKTWITTDATQDLPVVDPKTGKPTDKTVTDGGYQIHITPHSNTNGCIGMKNESDMDSLIKMVKTNEAFDPGTSTITVIGGSTCNKK